MAVLNLSLSGGAVVCADTPDRPPDTVIAAALATLPAAAPVVVLVHGYRYSPGLARTDPARCIYAPQTAHAAPRRRSWPEGLGFTRGGRTDGLCIGFGWPASNRDNHRSGRRGFAGVYARAAGVGAVLGALLTRTSELAPGRRIDLVAHSLGARVALRAAASAPAVRFGQIVLLGGAEYLSVAQAALAGPAARDARIYNVTARANLPYDRLFRRFADPELRDAPALGAGLGPVCRNAVDLPLDSPGFARIATRRGIALGAPGRVVCHWSFYTRPGTLALYAALLRERHNWTLPPLKAELGALPGPQAWRLPLPRLPGGGAAGPLSPLSPR